MPAVKLCSSICGGSGSAPKGKANLIWKMQIHKMCFERLAQFYPHVSSYRSTNVLNFSCEVDVERQSHSLIWKKQKIRKTGFKAKPNKAIKLGHWDTWKILEGWNAFCTMYQERWVLYSNWEIKHFSLTYTTVFCCCGVPQMRTPKAET